MKQSDHMPKEGADGSETQGVRTPWTTPRLTRLKARQAESGTNTITPEGKFAMGS